MIELAERVESGQKKKVKVMVVKKGRVGKKGLA